MIDIYTIKMDNAKHDLKFLMTTRLAGGIMDHLRFEAIFLQYGSNETRIMIVIMLSNIIHRMYTVRYVNIIMLLTN